MRNICRNMSHVQIFFRNSLHDNKGSAVPVSRRSFTDTRISEIRVVVLPFKKTGYEWQSSLQRQIENQ